MLIERYVSSLYIQYILQILPKMYFNFLSIQVKCLYFAVVLILWCDDANVHRGVRGRLCGGEVEPSSHVHWPRNSEKNEES